jgi:hypothetical protein
MGTRNCDALNWRWIWSFDVDNEALINSFGSGKRVI